MTQEYIPAKPLRTAPFMSLPSNLESRLQQSQELRNLIADKLTEGGTSVPETEEEMKMLLQTLREMDAVTLGEMKVRIDGEGKSSSELVKATIIEMTRSRMQLELSKPLEVPLQREIPPSPELDGEVELVPDETLIGQQSLAYADFRERFGTK